MELKQLADILVQKIKADYANDVSIVHVHGSYIYGNTHKLSDLDLFFVPKTERGFRLGTTFIINGIGTDFWALSWERLERIANHEEAVVSILTEGEVLYYNSNEDLLRFKKLGERSLELYKDKVFSISNAEKLVNNMYKTVYGIQKCKDISETRFYEIKFLYFLSFILAELNGISIKKGRKYLKEELLSMPLTLKNFDKLYDNLFLSSDKQIVIDSINTLFEELLELVDEQKKQYIKPNNFEGVFNGWYEEMVQHYNKIYHACEINDIYTPLFASVEYLNELNEMLEETGTKIKLPNIVEAYDPNDLIKIKLASQKHQKQFEELLHQKNINIKCFNDMDELNRYIKSL
jgi:hypothetical protein